MTAKQHLQKMKADLQKRLHEPNAVNNALENIESRVGVDRFYLVAGFVAMLALYLIFGHFAELVCNVIGFLYPAYMSIKAIETRSKDDDTQWLMYWVVFSLFNLIEFGSDFIVGWFPFYWLAKCTFILYLHLPTTLGAQHLYFKFIRPFVLKYQQKIDHGFTDTTHNLIDAARNAYDEHAKPN